MTKKYAVLRINMTVIFNSVMSKYVMKQVIIFLMAIVVKIENIGIIKQENAWIFLFLIVCIPQTLLLVRFVMDLVIISLIVMLVI